ncbi:unnamed protein product [Orchesella dallaii]
MSTRRERSTTAAPPPPPPTMAGNSDNPLSAHVLDTTIGRPVPGILITLSKEENGKWRKITEQVTNKDGRVARLISQAEFTPSSYKLNFNTKSYFESLGQKTFYPYIDVVFQVEKPEEHYHVPILLNAYGYSTYRGS